MMNESQPPDVSAQPPAAEAPTPQGVLSVNDTGAVSTRKRGKSGPAVTKGRTAAKRKPEKKLPAHQAKKTAKKAAKKAAGKTAGAGARFKSTTETSGWKSPAKRASGSKPTAAQKKRPAKKTPARKKAAAKRATGRR